MMTFFGLAISSFVFVVALSSLWNGIYSRTWPTTQGEVRGHSFRLVDHRKNIGMAQVHYQFEVNGEKFTSDRIAIDGFRVDRATATELHKAYPVGSLVKVHYKASNPSIAVLEAGVGSASIFVLIISSGFLILFAGIALGVF